MIPIHMLLDTATDCNILSFTSSEALKHASLLNHLNPEIRFSRSQVRIAFFRNGHQSYLGQSTDLHV